MRKTGTVIGAATVAALALAGCSTVTHPGDGDNGLINVVAATSVYGDLASVVGGDLVKVTSIISDPSQDPHSFEGNARVQLALSKADVVIENGGGYDAFVDALLAGVNNRTTAVLNAVDLSGLDQTPANGEFNEHVWYDFPTVAIVVGQIRDAYSNLDPVHAATFTSNADAFRNALSGLQDQQAALKAKFGKQGVAITEPVPLYLLQACGLVNKTPVKFSDAIETGAGVTPNVMDTTFALVSTKAVRLVAYNEQTAGPESDQLLAAATTAGVPVVRFTETLPKDKSYLAWMADNLSAVKAALG